MAAHVSMRVSPASVSAIRSFDGVIRSFCRVVFCIGRRSVAVPVAVGSKSLRLPPSSAPRRGGALLRRLRGLSGVTDRGLFPLAYMVTHTNTRAAMSRVRSSRASVLISKCSTAGGRRGSVLPLVAWRCWRRAPRRWSEFTWGTRMSWTDGAATDEGPLPRAPRARLRREAVILVAVGAWCPPPGASDTHRRTHMQTNRDAERQRPIGDATAHLAREDTVFPTAEWGRPMRRHRGTARCERPRRRTR